MFNITTILKSFFPENVRTIAVVNKTFPPKYDKGNSITESIMTAEVAASDKLALDVAIKLFLID